MVLGLLYAHDLPSLWFLASFIQVYQVWVISHRAGFKSGQKLEAGKYQNIFTT